MGSGDIYQGNFLKGARNGKGTYTWADGSRIEGFWVNGGPNSYFTYAS